jgi:hypothetical protein
MVFNVSLDIMKQEFEQALVVLRDQADAAVDNDNNAPLNDAELQQQQVPAPAISPEAIETAEAGLSSQVKSVATHPATLVAIAAVAVVAFYFLT